MSKEKSDMAASLATVEKINALGGKMPKSVVLHQLSINREMNNPPRRNPIVHRYK